jgi:rod shape-determining protein MreD
MRWLTFGILAGMCLVLQTGLAPHLALAGIRPDWMFVLAVFYAMLGPWPDACIAAWILGLLVDLESANSSGHGHLGLFAFTYGGTAWLIYQVRELIFREHWLAHTILTFLGALLVQSAVAVYRSVTAPPGPSPATGVGSYAVLTAVYTGFWAPYVHWVLSRLRGFTGLRGGPPGRRSVAR